MSRRTNRQRLTVNGRNYLLPNRPLAVICLDGADPAYFRDVLQANALPVPALRGLWSCGTWLTARASVPTFTNPNNVSIVTGAPPAVHGIAGNHFFDRELQKEVPMQTEAYLRCPTILGALAEAGRKVVVISAKKKLLSLLSANGRVPTFSAEDRSIGPWSDVFPDPPPDIYDPKASLWVLGAGAALLSMGRAEVVYLSTTDYVQHKYPPGTPQARQFFEGVDHHLGAILACGADLVLTADHGMNDKTAGDGSPKVIYLEPHLADGIEPMARVVLPITDAHVRHHGSLGSCASAYLFGRDPQLVRTRLLGIPGIEDVLVGREAAAMFELPEDRIGDLFILADAHTVLGKNEADHDLSFVRSGLRSHGGLAERQVPLISNVAPAAPAPKAGWRNSDAFWLVMGDPS